MTSPAIARSNVRSVASLIEARAGGDRPIVVAIDGRSGVGKSTYAAELAGIVGATIIEGDDFYSGGIEIATDPPAARVGRCIDWRRQRAVLTMLRGGGPAAYRPFDWERFDGSVAAKERVVRPATVILLEGVYSGRPELSDLVDLRILLRAPNAVRQQRLLRREGRIGDWERRWHEAEEWYFAHQLPATGFDLVVETGSDGEDGETRHGS